ncbi:hypothetical protein P343_05740 [Sporolactobacillus laevolacticus DSM 442]|uniref:Uncharacterized protein n=1 Tax=Sporolactobacillus laevolacticus DSM 442 TaxID=1395513 RepID=V6IZ50_9BACL|nr:hypothetical protein P343_05740 [Sporolactobacillus laevolacticus DSM 442]
MSNKKVGLTKDALASLSKFDSLSEGQLQQTQTGKWKTIATVESNTKHTSIVGFRHKVIFHTPSSYCQRLGEFSCQWLYRSIKKGSTFLC